MIKPRGSQANTGGRRFRAALAGEEFFSAKAGRVLAEARRLPPTERYAYLKEWVLPGDEHVGFRLRQKLHPGDAMGRCVRECADFFRYHGKLHSLRRQSGHLQ